MDLRSAIPKLLLILLALSAVPVSAQPSPAQNLTFVNAPPTGTCTAGSSLRFVNAGASRGNLYGCGTGNMWALLATPGTGAGCVPSGSVTQVLTDSGSGTCTSQSGVTIASNALTATGGFLSGSSPPALTSGTGGATASTEGTVPSVGAATAVCVRYADSTQHGFLTSCNNGSYLPEVRGPASSTSGQFATWNATNGGLLASHAIVTGDLPAALSSQTSINGLAITTSTGTLTVPNGVVLTGPSASGTVATLGLTNTFTGRQDASGAASTAALKTGTSLPGTCIVGDLYFKSDATAGQNIYQCQSTNTWTQQLNSGGGASGGGWTAYSAPALTLTAGTRYAPPGGGGTPSTTEADSAVKAPTAATITNYQVNTSAAPGTGNTFVFTWRKNGSDTSLTCTIADTATTCQDLTHSFTTAQNDTVDVKIVSTGTIVVTPMLTWLAQSGTTNSNGTVNSGTATHLTYYAATGTALSDAGTALVFDGTNTFTLSSSGVLDLSAGTPTTALKVPTASGAAPTANGFIAFNSNNPNRTFVWGSNGTTMVGAVAATGTGTATTCSNQVVTAVSAIAVPTCTSLTSAYYPTTNKKLPIMSGSTFTVDTSGNAIPTPLTLVTSITGPPFFAHNVVMMNNPNSGGTASCFTGTFTVPWDYVSTPAFVVSFMSTTASGNASFTVDYTDLTSSTAMNATTSQSGALSGTPTAVSGTANREATESIAGTSGDFHAFDLVQYKVCRVAASDTLGAALYVPRTLFSYTGTL